MTTSWRAIGRAGLIAATVSGAPSTTWALLRGDDPLAAARAAGTLLPGRRGRPGLAAGLVVHLGVSAAWTVVFGAAARGRRIGPARGAVAGAAIAALDLGVIAPRCSPTIAALPTGPQVLDHLLFGAVLGTAIPRG